jgi:uncharacterized protein YndB with AHSA1/START domain
MIHPIEGEEEQTVNDRATATNGILRIERLLPGPIEQVWAYLVEPGKRALWFAGGAFELRAGGKGQLEFDHRRLSDEPTPEEWKSTDGFVAPVSVTRIEPPRLLAWSWTEGERTSELSIELTAQGDKVRLVLTQSPVKTPEDLTNYGSGWHTHLDVLQDRLAGVKPRGFWTNFARLQQEYSQAS